MKIVIHEKYVCSAYGVVFDKLNSDKKISV